MADGHLILSDFSWARNHEERLRDRRILGERDKHVKEGIGGMWTNPVGYVLASDYLIAKVEGPGWVDLPRIFGKFWPPHLYILLHIFVYFSTFFLI